MRIGSCADSAAVPAVLAAFIVTLVNACTAAAQTPSINELVSAVVRINTHIAPEGRTVQGLGREREGSGSS